MVRTPDPMASTPAQQRMKKSPMFQKADSALGRRRDDLAPQYASLAEDDSKGMKKREAAMLFSVAEGHLTQDNAEECIKSAEDALARFREIGDDQGVQDTLRVLIDGHRWEEGLRGKKPQKALDVATEELTNFKEAGDKRGEGCMQLALADIMTQDYIGDQNLESALGSATDAVGLFTEIDDKKMAGEANLALVNIHFLKGRVDELKQAADEALALFKDADDKKGEARAIHGQALAHVIPENFETAVKKAKEALDLYKEIGDEKAVGRESVVIALWYNMHDQPQKALRLAKDAVAIFRKLDCGKANEGVALLHLVESLLLKSQNKQAIKEAKSGLTRFRDLGDQRGIVFGLQVLLQAHLINDEDDEALELADEALEVIQEMGNKRMEMWMHHLFAEVYLKMKQPEKAIRAMNDAIDVAQELDDPEEEAMAKHTISCIHCRGMDEVDKGIKASNDAREAFRRAGMLNGEGAALMIAALGQAMKTENEKAVSSASEAQELFQEDGWVRGQSDAMALLADVHLQDDKFDKALQVADERLELWQERGNKREQARALEAIARMHLSQDDVNKAEEVATEARDVARKTVDRKLEASILILISQIHVTRLGQEAPEKGPFPDSFNKIREKAARAASEAVTFAGKVGEGAKILRAAALFWRGHVYMWSGRADAALSAAVDAERLFRDQKHRNGEGHSLILQVQPLISQQKKDKAREIVDKALVIAREDDDATMEDAALKALDEIEGKKDMPQMPDMAMMQMMMMQQGGGGDGGGAAAVQSVQAAAPPKPRGLDPAIVKHKVLDMVKNVISSDDEIETDSPFMEAGMDSLSSVELVSQVAKEFQMALSPALIFDFPTVRAMVDHIVDESKAAIEGY